MEKPQGTSFIPQSPVRASKKTPGVRRVYLFTYITLIFFFGTLLAIAGVFFWDLSIDQQLSKVKADLALERESFNQADLEQVRELEKRMNTAYGILNRHVSVHSIIDALEKTTLAPVQLLTLDYIKDTNNTLELSVTASAPDFNTSIFQREVVSGSNILAGAEFSEIAFTNAESAGAQVTSDSVEEVTFTITKQLSTSDIPYLAPSLAPVAELVSEPISASTTVELDTAETLVTTPAAGVTNGNNQ